MMKSIKGKRVETYESLYDRKLYHGQNNREFFRTISSTRPSGLKTVNYGKIVIKYSKLDTSVMPEWKNRPLVTLDEDGNGAQITFTEKSDGTGKAKKVYLDYCQLHDLTLALNKFHEFQRYGMFKKLSKKQVRKELKK